MQTSHTAAVGVAFIAMLTAVAAGGPPPDITTIRASISSTGEQTTLEAWSPSINADGRYVAFSSSATNLVPDDTNDVDDVFLHDVITRETTRLSVNMHGEEGNLDSYHPRISADGRYVAFSSAASNLVPDDVNDEADIFLLDRESGIIERLSVNAHGEEANDRSFLQSMSPDARFFGFTSRADNLVKNDTNGYADAFVLDRATGEIARVSVSSDEEEANGPSGEFGCDVSSNGRYAVFESTADNLVPDDLNSREDVFLRDRLTGATRRVSIADNGDEANDGSFFTTISEDGRVVTFDSQASNLVEGDDNDTLDVFVRLIDAERTLAVNRTPSGEFGNDFSVAGAVSSNGRHVAFLSRSSNLVDGDTNDGLDLFVYDLQTDMVTRESISYQGEQASEFINFVFTPVYLPSLSADARFVAFISRSHNLVPGDGISNLDVFVHDVFRDFGHVEEFSVVFGRRVSGGLEDIVYEDFDRLGVARRPAVAPLLPPVRLEVRTTSPHHRIDELSFRLIALSLANPPESRQTIELLDHDAGRWVTIDERFASPQSQTVDVFLKENVQRFVGPGNAIRGRVSWFDPGALLVSQWSVWIDQTMWTAVDLP